MNKFTSYDEYGKILATGTAVNFEEQIPEVGGIYIGEELDGNEFYFLNGTPTARPELSGILINNQTIVANNEDYAKVLGVPKGAKVLFGGDSIISDGTDIELTTNYIGRTKLIVDKFPYKLWVGEIYGTAPK